MLQYGVTTVPETVHGDVEKENWENQSPEDNRKGRKLYTVRGKLRPLHETAGFREAACACVVYKARCSAMWKHAYPGLNFLSKFLPQKLDKT